MDYEKKYKEARRRAEEIFTNECSSESTKKCCIEIFPELAESEDEKIRKEIIQFFRDASNGNTRVVNSKTFAEWADYLEKQRDKVVKFDHDREQKHKIARWKTLGECSDIPDGHYVVGWFRFGDFRLGIMYKGLFVGTDGNRAEQPKEVFYIPNADEEFVYAEQKPVEWSDNFEENICNLLHEKLKWTSDDGSMSSAVFIDDKTLRDIISGIWFYVGKEALKYPDKQLNTEQVPTKWSDEDDNKLGSLICYFEGDALDCFTEDMIKWLESLPERFNLQLKREWSEEDKRILKGIIGLIDHDQHYGVSNKEMINWLKSLRPQPQWKPSEEQMEALKASTSYWRGVTNITPPITILESLYSDLKKL